MEAPISNQPSAVVFDFGGVMTFTPDRKTIVQSLCSSFHLSGEELKQVNRVKRQALKAGITDEEFWYAYAIEKEVDLPDEWPSTFPSVLKNAIGVNPRMFQLVDQLKAHKVPVALLSNIDERLAKWVREFGFYDPFEPCLLSYEIEIEKPDPKAYEFLIQKLGIPPAKVVFIDDQLKNIQAAEAFGLDAIQFESFEQIKEQLVERGFFK